MTSQVPLNTSHPLLPPPAPFSAYDPNVAASGSFDSPNPPRGLSVSTNLFNHVFLIVISPPSIHTSILRKPYLAPSSSTYSWRTPETALTIGHIELQPGQLTFPTHRRSPPLPPAFTMCIPIVLPSRKHRHSSTPAVRVVETHHRHAPKRTKGRRSYVPTSRRTTTTTTTRRYR